MKMIGLFRDIDPDSISPAAPFLKDAIVGYQKGRLKPLLHIWIRDIVFLTLRVLRQIRLIRQTTLAEEKVFTVMVSGYGVKIFLIF